MNVYAVSGTVETIVIRNHPDMQGICVTPPFYVRAHSAKQARAMAAQIIDPLEMTGLRHIAVVRVRRKRVRRWTRK